MDYLDRPDNEFAVRSAASAIARYLAERPNTRDTLEGVIDWWLARQREMDAVVVVTSAIELLLDERVLDEEPSAGGRTIYFLRKQVDKS